MSLVLYKKGFIGGSKLQLVIDLSLPFATHEIHDGKDDIIDMRNH